MSDYSSYSDTTETDEQSGISEVSEISEISRISSSGYREESDSPSSDERFPRDSSQKKENKRLRNPARAESPNRQARKDRVNAFDRKNSAGRGKNSENKSSSEAGRSPSRSDSRDDSRVDENRVIVYLLSSEENSPKIRKFHETFSDSSLFDFHVVDYHNSLKEQNGKEQLDEYLVQLCLTNAAKKYPRNSIIILKDTSVSLSNPWEITRIVQFINSRKNWDLCYLCTWMDVCETYDNYHHIPDTNVSLVLSTCPEGFQAVMLSHAGRQRLTKLITFASLIKSEAKNFSERVTENVNNQSFTAYRTMPNVFDYDLSLATQPADYLKVNPCRMPGSGVVGAGNGKNGFLVLPGSPAASAASAASLGNFGGMFSTNPSSGSSASSSSSASLGSSGGSNNNGVGLSIWIFVGVIIFIIIIAIAIYFAMKNNKNGTNRKNGNQGPIEQRTIEQRSMAALPGQM